MRFAKHILLAILILASLTRLINLNGHMPAAYGDEVAIGYNAYSILQTGRDEFGQFLPLQFESWGDKKNPVYIYAVSAVQVFLGPTPASVRLPSALAGIVAVYLTYRLVFILFQSRPVAWLTAFILTVSPWHLHISRGGYEANLALTFGLASMFYLFKYFENRRYREIIWSAFFAALAIYTYYTTKMYLPLLLMGIWGWAKFNIKPQLKLKPFLIFWIIFVIMIIPAVYLSLFRDGQARFQKINIFSDSSVELRVIRNRNLVKNHPLLARILENKVTYYLYDFSSYYLDHFSGQFLFVGGDSSSRYGIINHGMLYLVEAPFIFLGLLLLYRKNRKLWYFCMGWLLLAPLPTALVGKAYGLRSIVMLPVIHIFAAYWLVETFRSVHNRSYRLLFVGGVILLYTVSITNWGLRYVYQYPSYGRYWYDGAILDEINYAREREGDYDQIFLSNTYGKTDIYFAFYQGLDPSVYWQSQKETVTVDGVKGTRIGKYYFLDFHANERGFLQMDIPPNSLIISVPDFPYGESTINAVDDGRVLFKVKSNKPVDGKIPVN